MRTLIHCLFLLGIVHSTTTFGQTNLRFNDIRSLGMGGNGVVHSVLSNPACLSLSTTQSIGFHYFNKYQLKELSAVSVIYENPVCALPFALHLSTFGYDKYRETLFRLALSKTLSSRWVIGVSFQYALLQTELYDEEAKKLSTDLGMVFIPTENLLIGLSITDLPAVRLDEKNVHIEDFNYYSIQSGIQWTFINNLLIELTSKYVDRLGWDFGFGMEYRFYEQVFFRTGFSTYPLIPGLGGGLQFAAFRLDVSANYHPQLGICPGVGMRYSF